MGACGSSGEPPPPADAPTKALEAFSAATADLEDDSKPALRSLPTVVKKTEMENKLTPEEQRIQRELEEKQAEEDRERREREEKAEREREEREAAERAERAYLRKIVICQSVIRKWGVRRWYLQERDYVVQRVTVCQKLQRGRQSRRLASRLISSRRGLRHSLNELLYTEIRYCEALVILVEVYFRSFVSASKSEDSKISWNTVELIFGNVSQITNVHQTYLPQLSDLLRPPIHVGVLPRLRKIMSDLAKQVSIYYPEYINNFMRGQAELSRCMLQPEFAAFMEGIQARHIDRLGTQTLSSFLIMPIQRPPRYRLLLEDLVKHIDPYYRREVRGMQEVLLEINKVASSINEIQRVFEERQAFLSRMPMIKEHKKEPRDMDDGRRGLLAESKAIEFSGSDPTFTPRESYLFLMTDLLLVSVPYLNTSSSGLLSRNIGQMKEGMKALGEPRYDVVKKLAVASPFCPFQVYDLPDLPSSHYAIRVDAIQCDWQGEGKSTKNTSHFFDFESEAVKSAWLEHLQRLQGRTWREEDELSLHV